MAASPPSNQVTLTIDGQEVTVPRGTLVVEAAREIGIDIPVFCYHPKLSLVGACRMCSCEFQLPPPPGQQPRPPGILTACTTQVAPGMVVNTMGALALKHREAVIEFLLINHPLDCPVCDAGGECPLQDNSHAWGPKESRFEEDKRLTRKGAALSPLVVLDQERCIVCYRCTRFMAEVPGQAELDFFNRGYTSQLRTIDDQPMQSRFQGNIIELCPCGALTSETYRFRARPHDLDHADSICAQCPVGCNLILDTRANRMARVRARQNEAVNEIWLCDKGRFAYHYASHDDRLTQPLVKGADGALRGATWPEALGSVAVALREIKEKHGPGAIGVIGGRNLTNEDCYALARFASEVLETPNVDHRIGARTAAGNPLAAHGLNAFNSAFEDAEKAGAILLLGTDIYEEMPVLWLRVRKGIKAGAKLMVANPRATEADRLAFRRLRYRPGQELAVLRGLAAAIGGGAVDDAARESGVSAETLRAAAETLKEAKDPLIYVGARLALRADADSLAAALVSLGEGLRAPNGINWFTEGANGRGAEYAGLLPGEGGLPAGEIIAQAAEGRIKALYLVGENVLHTHPDAAQAERALQNAELVVLHELFVTETARHADVVFAATSFAEKDGSLTNAEGRLQRIHSGIHTAASARPDWRILSDLSGEMDVPLGYAAAVEVTRDLLADLTTYSALGTTKIPSGGLIARPAMPAQPAAAPLAAAAPAATGGGGSGGGGANLTLITYSELLGDETTVRATEELTAMLPEPYIELNRDDAVRLGLTEGQWVDVSNAKGSLRRVARVNGRCQPGTCYAPDNLGQPRINALQDWAEPLTRVRVALAAEQPPAAAPVAAGASGGH